MHRLYLITEDKEIKFVQYISDDINFGIRDYVKRVYNEDTLIFNQNIDELKCNPLLKDGYYIINKSLYKKFSEVITGYIYNSNVAKVEKLCDFGIERNVLLCDDYIFKRNNDVE